MHNIGFPFVYRSSIIKKDKKEMYKYSKDRRVEVKSTSNHMFPKINNRDSSIELLRIISMLMIVAGHFATHGGFCFDTQSITIPRLWWNLIEMGGNFGVDVFVLISGYYLIENKSLSFDIKRLLKFWGQIFFYSVFLFVFAFIIGRGSFAPRLILRTLFPIISSEWWFASTYFVLYLLHPYINRLLYTFSKEQYRQFLILFIIIWSVVPIFTLFNFQSNELLEFILIYIIAGYIRIWGFKFNLKSKRLFCLWIVFRVFTYLTCIVFIILGVKHTIFLPYSLFFYERTKIPTLLRAISFLWHF